MSSQTLRDFINKREGEIKAEIRALNDELRELRAAKSAIDASFSVDASRNAGERMTHRDMIAAVLDANPEGGTFDRVIEMVKERFNVEIPQNSMSSQLSRAKSDGLVELEMGTKIWRLAKHVVKKNEPPEGGSETGAVGAAPDPTARAMPRPVGYQSTALTQTNLAPHSGREGGD